MQQNLSYLGCLLALLLSLHAPAQPDSTYWEVAVDVAPLLYDGNQSQLLLRQHIGDEAWRYGFRLGFDDNDQTTNQPQFDSRQRYQSFEAGLTFGWQRQWKPSPVLTYFGLQGTLLGSLSNQSSEQRRLRPDANLDRLDVSETQSQSVGLEMSPLVGCWYQWQDHLRIGGEAWPTISVYRRWSQRSTLQTQFDFAGGVTEENESQTETVGNDLDFQFNRASLVIWLSYLF